MKLSVNNENELRAWNCATIQQVSILNFAVGPQKLSGFSRNGPLARKILHFVSLTDSFIMLDAKLLKLLSCMQTTALRARY